jgi:lysylphosphatidylglycerol synthetase-like protein (DUF2156 family)
MSSPHQPRLRMRMFARVLGPFFYTLIHLGRSLIKLESLYRHLRKFHAFGERRYVLLSLRHIPVALVVLLSLEFIPRRRHLRIR